MGILDVLMIIVSVTLMLSLPGLPFVLVLLRKRLLTWIEALALMPTLSISLSVTSMIGVYFGFDIKFSTISWALVSSTITLAGAIWYYLILYQSRESLLSHATWVSMKIKAKASSTLKSRNAWLLLAIMSLGVVFSLWFKFGYYHPVHTDEWHYWAHAQNMINQGEWGFQEVYYGYSSGNTPEGGFLLTLGTFQHLSGIGWNWLFVLGPVLLAVLTILTCYAIGKIFEAGLPSALMGALLPTTLRFLGPGFLVPVTLGLLLILGLILMLIRFKSFWLLPLIIIVELYALFMHPPTALVGLLIIGTAGFAHMVFREWRYGMMLMAVSAASFLIAMFTPFLWSGDVWSIRGTAMLSGGAFFLPQMSFESYVKIFGFWLFLLGFLGLGLLIWERKRQNLTLALTSIAVGGLALSFRFVLNRVQDVQALLDRTTFLFFGLLTISTGVSVSCGWKWSKKAMAIVLAVVVGMAFYNHANEPYYKIVSEEQYDDFVWIHDNLNGTYNKAILDPWVAIAFSPITEKQVYYQIPQGPDHSMAENVASIQSFFNGGCSNTTFLTANDISIVYTNSQVNNSDLVEVHPRVYLLQN